jgi:hypothetical protein
LASGPQSLAGQQEALGGSIRERMFPAWRNKWHGGAQKEDMSFGKPMKIVEIEVEKNCHCKPASGKNRSLLRVFLPGLILEQGLAGAVLK